jgi:hypothetical protein
MGHYHHIRERCRSCSRVTQIEDPRGHTELRRQRLDWAGTPAGQHGTETPAPRLHGHKAPSITVGTVDQPVCTISHGRLAIPLLRPPRPLASEMGSPLFHVWQLDVSIF